MRFRSWAKLGLTFVALAVAFTTVWASDYKDFDKVWNGRKSTNLEKAEAINQLPVGEKDLAEVYIDILESDVWQYRARVLGRVQSEKDEALLNELGEFLFEDKKVARQPAAGEHLVWALYNNATWATTERWMKAGEIVKNDRYPEKVRARVLRELGFFRGLVDNAEAQELAKTNVRTLIDVLAWQVENERDTTRNLVFLTIDALESLTSEENGTDVSKWTFFLDNLKEPLKPRQKDTFKDEFKKVEIEGHSFARKTPRPVDLELLILPNLYTSDKYWYPSIFELNKTFKCTFVQLPDCSKMDNIEWLKDRAGNVDRSAYFYPLEQLVEAFEERREESKQKKIGIVAHAVSGWIALEYLRLHPESVAFAVIIGTWSGEQSREKARNNCVGSKDEAYKYYGESLLYDPSGRTGSLSLDDSQQMWAATGSYKRRWADPKALEPIFYNTDAYKVKPEGSARILVPKYEFEKVNDKRIDTPVLFIHGAQDPMFVDKDEKAYKKTFTNMYWKVFEEAAATPWAEQPVQFFEAFEEMLEDHKIIEKLKEEAAEAAEEED